MCWIIHSGAIWLGSHWGVIASGIEMVICAPSICASIFCSLPMGLLSQVHVVHLKQAGVWPGCLAGLHVINIYTVGEGRQGLCLVWDKSTMCVSEYVSSVKLVACVSLQMISANKQLIENADAVQERIAQVQKEGEFDEEEDICSVDLSYIRLFLMKVQHQNEYLIDIALEWLFKWNRV